MTKTLTASHKTALAAGRARREHEMRCQAIARVDAYRRWLRKGSRLRDIPTIPTDADFRTARRAGKVS